MNPGASRRNLDAVELPQQVPDHIGESRLVYHALQDSNHRLTPSHTIQRGVLRSWIPSEKGASNITPSSSLNDAWPRSG